MKNEANIDEHFILAIKYHEFSIMHPRDLWKSSNFQGGLLKELVKHVCNYITDHIQATPHL